MNVTKKKPIYKRKRYNIIFIIIVLLIVFRFYLPTLVKNYVNNALTEIPGYYGQVKDIDIALFRGAYVINGLYLDKVNAETKVPFLKFPKTDISVEWKSLFKGEIVTEIIMDNPEIIYVFEDQQSKVNGKEADVDDWSKVLTDLVPIEINSFEAHNGKLAFVQLSADPDVDLSINNLDLMATNLRNVEEKGKILPSSIKASGVSFGGGNVKLEGAMNIIKEIPDMDIAFSLEKSNAVALNDFTNYYAGLDFESGTAELYSEIAIADGFLKGYMKPLLINSKFIGKEDGFLETLWEGFVGFFKFVLKNQITDTLATEIPIEGDLNNVEADIFSTVGGIIKNAWIKAFKGETNDTIEFEDAFKEAKELTSKKREKSNKKIKIDT